MAAIGKIRSWGPWLVGIIGLALFGFIATDFTRSCESQANQERQLTGEVLGNKLQATEWQEKVKEFKYILSANGQEGADEEMVKDMVWDQYIQNAIIRQEAEKLGLAVTDAEFKAMLQEGTNPVFMQVAQNFGLGYISDRLGIRTSFINQQTRKFDYSVVSQLYNNLKQASEQNPQIYGEEFEKFNGYWMAMEKLLREQMLANKYYTLLSACMLSNPVSGKAAFDDANVQTDILLAWLPYSNILDNDASVQPTEAELKAKYDEQKEKFKWNKETRDIKYVVCQVVASEEDKANLSKELVEAGEQLGQVKADSLSIEDVVATHRSKVGYHGLGYTRSGLNKIVAGLADRVDTMSVGEVSEPFIHAASNTMTLVKLLGKNQEIDSIQIQGIMTVGQTVEAAKFSADSIVKLVNEGTPFDSITFYGQSVTKDWICSDQYQNAENITPDFVSYITTIRKSEPGKLLTLPYAQGYLIYKVVDRKAAVTKYDVAVIQRDIDYTSETRTNAYNKFSEFLSESATIEALEQNLPKYASNGFVIKEQKDLTSDAHNVGQYSYDYATRQQLPELPNTQEALKWVFDEAKEGSISKLYDNINSGSTMLAVAVTKVHPKGYLDLESVKDELTEEVIRDKKFEQLSKKLANVKSIDQAVQQGADTLTIPMVTFGHVTIQPLGRSDRRLSGAVAATPEGQFSKKVVKGDNAAYVFQVLSRKQREGVSYDAAAAERQSAYQGMQALRYVRQALIEKANIVDNRYKLYN